MKRRVEVNWGGGDNSIILRVTTGELLSYEDEIERVHELFGGKCFYTSRSGLSGAGYIERGDFLLMGRYRIDCPGSSVRTEAPVYSKEGVHIWGFAPIESHKGVNPDYPVVLVVEEYFNRVYIIYVEHEKIMSAIKEWKSLNWEKSKEYPLFTQFGDKEEQKVVRIIDTKGWSKNQEMKFCLRASRFISFLLDSRNAMNGQTQRTFLEKELHLLLVGPYYKGEYIGRKFVHYNIDGVFDKIIKLENECDLPEGWRHEKGLFYKRGTYWSGINAVKAFVFFEYEGLELEYEAVFPVIEFYEMGIDKIRESLKEKAIDKAINEEMTRIKDLLAGNKDKEIRIEDAVKLGFCERGVIEFAEKYEISLPIRCEDLLSHPQINKILFSREFRRFITKYIASTGGGEKIT